MSTLTLNSLPEKSKLDILSYLDLESLENVAALGKEWHVLATDPILWKTFAKATGFSFDPDRSYAYDEQVKHHIYDLKRTISFIPDLPENIKQILQQASTIENINILQKFFKKYIEAMDTLVVWKKLAENIHQTVPELPDLELKIQKGDLHDLPSFKETIDHVDNFSIWLNQHKIPLSQLYSLNITRRLISSVPYEIFSLIQPTRVLFLCYNVLDKLPKEIGNLTKLNDLYLGCNRLTKLPKEIGKLSELKKLDLSDNRLTTLPKEIGELTKLENLNINENPISFLPPEIKNLTNLKIQFNNRIFTPSEIFKELNKS